MKAYFKDLIQTAKELGFEVIIASSNLYRDLENDPILSIQTTYEKIFTKKGFDICYLQFKV